jgi:chaperone BCS1
MFLRFYEDQEEFAEEFCRAVSTFPVSTAQLQGHFVFYKKDPQSALANVDSLKQ